MLNDFPMMVLAVVTTQVGIAGLLVLMARLEPDKTIAAAARPAGLHPEADGRAAGP